MRKMLWVVAFVSCLTVIMVDQAPAQSWSWLHPRPTGDSYGKIEFLSATHGWIGLEHGRLLKTVDGAVTWQVIDPDINTILESIEAPPGGTSFVDPATGWYMGTVNGFDNPSGAALYRTTDAGLSWTAQMAAVDDFGLAVEFVDANNGWAVTGSLVDTFPNVTTTIYHSTNGGSSFTPQYTTGIRTVSLAISFFDSSTGWAIIDSLVMDVVEDDVLLAEPSRIIHTSDAGATWDTLAIDPTPGGLIYLQFIDTNNGWTSGENGKLLKTTDGGNTWIDMAPTAVTDSTFVGPIFFLDSLNGWVAAERDSTFGSVVSVFRTNDAGVTWSETNLGFQGNISSFHFFDTNNGVYGGEGSFMRTSDGGQTWTEQGERVTFSWMRDVFFLDATDGWIASGDGLLFATDDGGCAWAPALAVGGTNFNSVFVANATTGWVVADAGVIYEYNGTDWTLQVPCCNNDLYAVWANFPSDAFAVGSGGKIRRTVLGTWVDDAQSGIVTTSNLQDLWGVDSNLVAVGDNGTIVTYDGTTWSLDSQSGVITTENLRGVWGTAMDNLYAVSDNGSIFRTSGVGSTWEAVSSGEFAELFDIWGTSASDVYAVGWDGTVVHDDGGGVFMRVDSGARSDFYGVGTNPGTGVTFAVGRSGDIIASTNLPPSCALVSVAIAGFFGDYTGTGVQLRWIISEADGLQGFNIYRSSFGGNGPFSRVNGALISSVSGNTFTDTSVEPGVTYWYRLGAVDNDGEFYSYVIRVEIPAVALRLGPTYPNPFNPSTTIAYSLPETGHVRLVIYDVRGSVVRRLEARTRKAGAHTVAWNGHNDRGNQVSSGVYFARLEFGRRVLTERLVLLK